MTRVRKAFAWSLVLAAVALAAGADTRSVPRTVTSGAMRVYVDPRTGGLGPPPDDAGARADLAGEAARAGRSDGLVEVPSNRVGGGFAVDLEGRFHSHSVAVVGADGTIRSRCVAGPPPSDAPPR